MSFGKSKLNVFEESSHVRSYPFCFGMRNSVCTKLSQLFIPRVNTSGSIKAAAATRFSNHKDTCPRIAIKTLLTQRCIHAYCPHDPIHNLTTFPSSAPFPFWDPCFFPLNKKRSPFFIKTFVCFSIFFLSFLSKILNMDFKYKTTLLF